MAQTCQVLQGTLVRIESCAKPDRSRGFAHVERIRSSARHSAQLMYGPLSSLRRFVARVKAVRQSLPHSLFSALRTFAQWRLVNVKGCGTIDQAEDQDFVRCRSIMRVISGSAKGRNLQSVPGDSTRPITDRVKEALFDILGGDILDAEFLDLFGGTGGVGIEALSRGARRAVFVDKNRKAQETIKANLLHTHLSDRGEIVRGDAFTFLAGGPRPFHYIYIAPPQYHRLWVDALLAIDQHPDWLNDDGEIIVQIHPKEFEDVPLAHFEIVDERKYGSTLLIFYEHREANSPQAHEDTRRLDSVP